MSSESDEDFQSGNETDDSEGYVPEGSPAKKFKGDPAAKKTKAPAQPRKPRAPAQPKAPKAPAQPKKPKAAKAQGSTEEVTKTPAKRVYKKSTKTDAPTEIRDEAEDTVIRESAVSSPTGNGVEKSVEEIYKKKSQLEHILLRPDTYIGTVEAEELEMWVFSSEDRIEKKKINYVPGLYKIIDEILVNAADNKIRDPSMNTIKVLVDPERNFISIQNNGKGIPIQLHKDEQVYVPELIFGHLLTSSNYDDTEKKVTGGRNGYGAKLCNIFSTEFIVETASKEQKLKYYQKFTNNMSTKSEPIITNNGKGEEFTRISFTPDLSKFGMTRMDEGLASLIKKRVYDLAGTVEGINVFYNGTKIPVKGFKQYVELYTESMDIRNAEGKKPIIHDTPSPRWQVSFAVSDGQFNQVSFVNSICTPKGGTHANYVADQLVKALLPEVQKKSGNKNIKPFHIKSHMCVFVNCLIENPTFDSQTKENMTLRVSGFGSTYQAGDKFISAVSKSGIIDNIVKWVKFKEDVQMTKADSGKMAKRLNIPKLEDANCAGTKPKNKLCTLILTEGDSAKGLVMGGLSQVGRDLYGVFPLRGKLLNVRDAATSAIMNNNEITNIKSILGLKHGHKYTSVDELRYGKLMIMTDQDHDGSHIKGLLINFIDQMFPSLLDIPGFLLEFITPIIRCTHKRNKTKISFFTIPEYEQWAHIHNKNNEWEPKYFKGLGTSDNKDAKEYFGNLGTHVKEFCVADTQDRELIEMAFAKKKITERKDWLNTYEPGIYIDHNVQKIKISDFVNKELMLFSMADNIRSIPSMVDGFKPGQRKAFYGASKRAKNTEMKVSQLANYVAGITQYHHGETAMATTLIGMAQEFVGSNNLNLFFPAGQFGSRYEGGKNAASPRYLNTRLMKIARYVFPVDDDSVLNYLIDENKRIEPNWYVPILPMVLVNGADGIGTGWSTSIPNYNPLKLVANLKRLMNDEELLPLKPWFRGFKGEIEYTSDGRYSVNGICEMQADGNIKVTELPIRYWTESFKEHLEMLRDPKDNKKADILIHDYNNNSTDATIDFTIFLDSANLEKAHSIDLMKTFKLAGSITTTNMVCFDPNNKIKRYSGPEEIIRDFYKIRLEYYEKRKNHLIAMLDEEYLRADNKSRFIQLVIDKTLVYIDRKEEEVVANMEKHGLKRMHPQKGNVLVTVSDDDENTEEESSGDSSGYEYLFNINVRGFTVKKVEELRKQRDTKLKELEAIKTKDPKDFWREDLDAFVVQWEALLEEDRIAMQNSKPMASVLGTKRKTKAKPKASN
ncbi:DNA topoisomerase [Spinellus fusiger]|nr:DNA topoisomerase [Spinellus fusiger]